MDKLIVFTDGGARGNPGPAAVGVVIKDNEEKIVASFGKCIGETTNNVAEYMGVIEALRWITENLKYSSSEARSSNNSSLPTKSGSNSKITFFLDSKLVVNQLGGLYKIKDIKLRELAIKVKGLEKMVSGKIDYQLVPREQNRQADKLVNQALDNHSHIV